MSINSGDKFRQSLPESRRVVVKIGSRVIVRKSGKPDKARIKRLVLQLAAMHREVPAAVAKRALHGLGAGADAEMFKQISQ